LFLDSKDFSFCSTYHFSEKFLLFCSDQNNCINFLFRSIKIHLFSLFLSPSVFFSSLYSFAYFHIYCSFWYISLTHKHTHSHSHSFTPFSDWPRIPKKSPGNPFDPCWWRYWRFKNVFSLNHLLIIALERYLRLIYVAGFKLRSCVPLRKSNIWIFFD